MNATDFEVDHLSVNQLQARIAELEAKLEQAQVENGMLRLQLDVLASLDIVTGLPNVTGMMDVLENALARSIRAGEAFGVLSVHIPALGAIAERHGKDALREALRHSGAMIAAGLRALDTVGRLDDTGFLVTLPMLEEDGLEAVVGRITDMLARVPMQFGDEEITLSADITAVMSMPADPAPHASALISDLLAARNEGDTAKPTIIKYRS